MENQLTLASLNLWTNEFSLLRSASPFGGPPVGTHLGSPHVFTKPSAYITVLT